MVNTFKLFKELLFKLTKYELASLRKNIGSNSAPGTANKSKSIKLINVILATPSISKITAEKKIYGSISNGAFEKLIDRAIERIDEEFILFNRDATQYYSLRNYYYFFLKRKLLILQMRWLRGIDFDLQHQFDRIIKLSEKFELMEILIDALYAKQRYVGFRYGNLAFNKIQAQIEEAEFKRKAIADSRSIQTKYIINQTALFISIKDELKRSIKTLKQYDKVTNSPTIKFFLLYLEIEWMHMLGKYYEAEILLNRLLKLVVENPSVYTKAKHAGVFLNLASNEIYLRDFNLAIKNAQIAQSLYEKKTETIALAREHEFYARFYNNEMENSEKIIEEIYNFSKQGNVPFFYGKRAYLFACIKTIRGDIEKSNELLLEVKEIEKDKGGWNLGKRMLTIINRIEAGDLESVDLKVLSLEKFVKRISKANYVRKRDKIILRILLKLINEGFDFNKVYKQRKKYFDLLESSDPDYAWKIKSPELIVFHDWFKGKMKEKVREEVLI